MRKDSPDSFTLLVASAETQAKALHEIKILDRHARLTVEYGDFADAMQKAVVALTEVGCWLTAYSVDLVLIRGNIGQEVCGERASDSDARSIHRVVSMHVLAHDPTPYSCQFQNGINRRAQKGLGTLGEGHWARRRELHRFH